VSEQICAKLELVLMLNLQAVPIFFCDGTNCSAVSYNSKEVDACFHSAETLIISKSEKRYTGYDQEGIQVCFEVSRNISMMYVVIIIFLSVYIPSSVV
jgi:hypothetical protein